VLPKKQKTDIQDISLNEDLQKEKDEIAAKLSAPKVKAVSSTTGPSSTGKSELDPKVIERLREKKRNKDRTEIRDDAPAVIEKKSKFFEMDAAVTKEIINRERQLVSRASILQVRNKKGFSTILTAATASLKKDDQRKKEEQQKKAAENKEKYSYDRYGEVDQDKFWKGRLQGNETDEWQIDTQGTFADKGRMPDVSQIPKEVKPKQKTSSKTPDVPVPEAPAKNVVPLIIVPSGFTALLSMYNVKDFLQDGNFKTSVDRKNTGAKKENVITIERKKANGTSVPYQICDTTTKFSSKDWERVAAVFVLGQLWQFKGWHWENPVDLFTHVPGFFLHYEEDKIPETIKSWDVKKLVISKNATKKHMSQTASLEFWDAVDNFCQKKKPFLKF